MGGGGAVGGRLISSSSATIINRFSSADHPKLISLPRASTNDTRRNDVSLVQKKKSKTRLISISTAEGKWQGNWDSHYIFSLRDLQLLDLSEYDHFHKGDTNVSITLSVEKVLGFKRMDRKRCHCGLEPVIRTSYTPSFPAMRYWGCPNVGEHVCCFIDWIDPKPCKLTIEYIKTLRAENEDTVSKMQAKTAECLMMSQVVDNASQSVALYHKERDDLRHQLRIKEIEFNVLKESEKELTDLASNVIVEAHELSEELKELRNKLLFQNVIMKFVIVMFVAAAVIVIV